MKASDNPFPSILVEEATDPAAPASGHKRLFIDSADHKLKSIDSSSTLIEYGQGVADQGAFTYFDATEAAAPATPASGKVRIYAKTDGRIYSKDDAGVEYGPFDEAGSGGADLSDFRLSGVADDPGTLALGTYGDEFEYTTQSAVTTAGWAATNSLPTANWRPTGSAIFLVCDDTTSGRGLVFDTGGSLPDDFEVAVLLSGLTSNNAFQSNMIGLGVVDSSGNGIANIPYYTTTTGYTMTMSSYAYSATGGSGSSPAVGDLAAPYWLSIERSSGTTWTTRWSADGSSWTTIVASRTQTVASARQFYVGPIYNAGIAVGFLIHRLVYATPNL